VIRNIDPYKTDFAKRQLTRSYRVATFTWSAAHAAGDDLQQIRFPEALMTQPFISEKMKDYMMMRSDVEWYARVVSTGFHYGTVMSGWIPYYDHESPNAFRHRNLVSLSQCNAMEISASTGISTKATIPWCSPNPYIRIAQIGSAANRGVIGTLFFKVLNPLRGAAGSTPDPVEIQVFANFTDSIELAGYSPDTETVSSHASLVRSRIAAQSKLIDESKAKSETFAGVSEAVSTIQGIIGSVTDAASIATEMMSSLGPLAAMLNKPATVNTPIPTYDSQSTVLNYGTGIDTATKMCIKPDSCVSASGAALSTSDPQPRIPEVLGRPTFVGSWTFTAATAKDVWTVQYVLNPSNSPKVHNATARWPGGVYQPTYMAYYSRFFRFWRGGIKYMLSFRTSPNVQADFRVAHFPEFKTFTLPLEDYDGDIVSEVIGVRGDTTVQRTIPFVSETHWKEVDKIQPLTAANSMGVLAIALASPIQTMGAAVDAEIYVNLYVAAAPDFDLMSHVSDSTDFMIDPLATILTAPEPKILAQADLRTEFTKPFPGIRPCSLNPELGFVNHEHIEYVTDLTKHYSDWVTYLGLGGTDIHITPTFNPAGATPSLQSNSTGRLLFPFLFWRGSMRAAYPYMPSDTVTGSFLTSPTFSGRTHRDNFRGPYAWGGPNPTTSLVIAELPWNRPRLHNELVPTHVNNEYPVWFYQTGNGGVSPTFANAIGRLFMSTGDDFSCGPLSACPPIGSPTASEPSKLREMSAPQLSESTMEKLHQYLAGKGKAPLVLKNPQTSSSSY